MLYSQNMQGGPFSINKHPHGFPVTKYTIMLSSYPGRQKKHEPESDHEGQHNMVMPA